MAGRPAVMALALLIALPTLAGCEKPLFPPGVARSPYERYQVLRGRYRPATEENVYGGEQPALRQRLQPLESP